MIGVLTLADAVHGLLISYFIAVYRALLCGVSPV